VSCLVARAAGATHLFCANAGDCRAVLYTGPSNAKKAIRLSEDHKPQPNVCPAEITRVCEAGGCVLWGRVQVRICFRDENLRMGSYLTLCLICALSTLSPETLTEALLTFSVNLISLSTCTVLTLRSLRIELFCESLKIIIFNL
jgi:hypothetical protein